jgi:hypothetical protein
MTLAHPTITIAELAALREANPSVAIPAQVIDLFAGKSQSPYKLIWLRGPDGNQRLYRLVPEPTTKDTGHE